jgi:uncharacterized protein
MHQTWRDLLFAHWPVPRGELRRAVPEQMEIDTFDGEAWLAVVPFAMTGIRGRGLPAVPGVSAALELNVRTYVRAGGLGGVYFFSLDCTSRVMVETARAVYHLPYFRAAMSMRAEGKSIRYTSDRRDRRGSAAQFRAAYWPVSEPYLAAKGSLERWLTERYCLFTTDTRGRLVCAHIHHAQWPLQRAAADFEVNTMAEPMGIAPPGSPPLLHFAKALDVKVWRPSRAE